MKAKKILILLIIPILFSSCQKIKEYFHDPDPEPLSDLLRTSRVIGFVSEMTMSAIQGGKTDDVHVYRSNSGYPCTALMLIKPDRSVTSFMQYYPGKIVVAGYWPDENSAIISFILSEGSPGGFNFTLKNICTIPVMRDEDGIFAVFAGMDINLDEEGNGLLQIAFTQDEIDVEMERLDYDEPEDIYVAVEQKAWVIRVNDNNTSNYYDDIYSVTGGGQFITATNSTIDACQQAVLDVRMDHICSRNPYSGMALIQKAAVEDDEFPETGVAVFSFGGRCDGRIKVEVGTGAYITSIGKEIPFSLD